MSDRSRRDRGDRRKDVEVEVIREQILTRTSIVPETGKVEGGFVLTQVVDIEKAIKMKDVTCLLEKKIPIQLAVICFETEDDD